MSRSMSERTLDGLLEVTWQGGINLGSLRSVDRVCSLTRKKLGKTDAFSRGS